MSVLTWSFFSTSLRLVSTLFAASVIAAGAHGQDPHYTYPFEVECPGVVRSGEEAVFSIKFPEGVKQPDSTFSWTVSAGTITGGQGTPTITVETTGVDGSITATVERNLGDRHWIGVQSTGSCTAVIEHPPQASMVDTVMTAANTCELMFMLLDNFYMRLAAEPMSQGVIIIYADVGSRNAAERRVRQIRNHIRLRRFDPGRITVIRGPARAEAATQFWLVHPGAPMPEGASDGIVVPLTDEVPSSLPYHYATQFSDGVPGCDGHLYDLGAFADLMKRMPAAGARIIIGEASRAAFNRTARETIAELTQAGVARRRIRTVFRKVPRGQLREFSELWLVK